MRLIDADELEKVITQDWFVDILLTQTSKYDISKNLVNMIDSVPLAYDVEKAVEEVKKIAGCNDKCAKTFYQGMGCKACMWNTMMNLIREGGVNG